MESIFLQYHYPVYVAAGADNAGAVDGGGDALHAFDLQEAVHIGRSGADGIVFAVVAGGRAGEHDVPGDGGHALAYLVPEAAGDGHGDDDHEERNGYGDGRQPPLEPYFLRYESFSLHHCIILQNSL